MPVWLSEVMLQQTTVAAVAVLFLAFTGGWPAVGDLAAAGDGDVMAAWAGLGYYARARNLLACAGAVAREHGGPSLTAPRASGPSPASAPIPPRRWRPSLRPAADVVDGNVERVAARLFAVGIPLPRPSRALAALAATLTVPRGPATTRRR